MVALRRRAGFTLIEAMIVVVIIGITATLAVVAYRKWVQTSHLAEAQDLVSHIRSAEDTFRSENGVTYLPVSGNLGPPYDYPAPTPGAFKTGWGGPCATCVHTNSWQQLAVQPSGPVMFGYSVVTNPVTDPTGANTTPPTTVVVNGVTMNLTSLQGQPWYVIRADGDYFGTGSFTTLYAISGNNQVFISNGTQ
jgi:prepilin-type N-terminal cleavage/methylation domain-containing protein